MRAMLLAMVFALAVNLANAAPPARDIDSAVTQAMQGWLVPGVAIVVVQDGKVHHLKGYGVREVGKAGEVDADTLFCLGSCSKAFTTAAMALLVDAKKLHWDDRVRDHLPTFRLSDDLADGDVRLRDLVCHRTGVGQSDLLWYRAPWTPEEGVERHAHLPLSKPFRTTFQYNSVTFTAAGLAAAAADNTTWDALIQKRLLTPLAMKRTLLEAASADKDANRVRPHRLNRNNPEPFAAVNMRRPDAAGSVHSCARDLAAWLQFHLDEGKIGGRQHISASALRETHTPQIPLRQGDNERRLFPETTQSSYAMAWVVLNHGEVKVLAHGGVLDGQRTQILLVPQKKLGIAVLSNLDQTPMNAALSFTLLEMYLDVQNKRDYNSIHAAALKARATDGEKARLVRLASRRENTKPSLALKAYAGTYSHKAFGDVKISAEHDVLVWEYRGEKIAMDHFHHDVFLVRGELPTNAELTFEMNDRGEVRGFAVTGYFNVTFTRGER